MSNVNNNTIAQYIIGLSISLTPTDHFTWINNVVFVRAWSQELRPFSISLLDVHEAPSKYTMVDDRSWAIQGGHLV